MGYLVDTTVWIEVERDRLRWESIAELTGTEPVFVSPVTLAELKFGAERAKDPDVRSRRLAGVEAILRKPILPIDGTTGIIFGDLSARLHTSGRDRKFRLHDLWIGAQAVQHGLTVLTHNPKDFIDIPGVQLHRLKFAV